jgi:hypothetical protein
MPELRTLRRSSGGTTRSLRAAGSDLLGSMSLVRANTPDLIADVRQFRARTYWARSSMVIDDDVAVDERSYLFALRAADEIVACTRVLVLPDPAAGINEFRHPLLSELTAATEVGRLAVARRTSPYVLFAMLGLAADWMLEHTEHDEYIAFCRPRLVAAYEAVGARDLGIQVDKPGTDRPYRFVVGRIDVAAERALEIVGASGRERRRSA